MVSFDMSKPRPSGNPLRRWIGRDGPARPHDELDFLPAFLEVVERPPARGARTLVWVILLICLIAVVWSVVGRVDVVASAPGQLILGQHSKVIQAMEQGVVTRILVRDGQAVRAGDTLIELNPTNARADVDKFSEQLLSSEMEIARLRALLADDPLASFAAPPDIAAERVNGVRQYLTAAAAEQQGRARAHQARLRDNEIERRALQKVIKETDALLVNVATRLEARETLARSGNFPKLQVLDQEKERIELSRDRAERMARLETLQSVARSMDEEWLRDEATRRRETFDRLRDEERRLADSRQEFVKATDRSSQQRIVAPVDGVVQQLALHTIGGVARAAETMMVLVPSSGDLEAQVHVLSKDVGFVQAGQSVEIKIDSFPYTKYGTIRGTVLTVSRDSAKDEKTGLIYPTRVRLERFAIDANGSTVALTPGMSIVAEIRTADRRVIEYLLSPIQEYVSSSMRER